MGVWSLREDYDKVAPYPQYLFLLCAVAFSALISKAEINKHIMGLACSRGCPRISYLFLLTIVSYFVGPRRRIFYS